MSKIDFSKFNYGNASDHIKELEDIVGKENVLTNMHDRAMRAASCAPFPMQRWGEHVPDVVVLPGSTEEVSAVMKLADTYRLPVVPRGAGAGLADGAHPLAKGIVLDMKRMSEILEVDDVNRTATVQPGVNMQELNKVLVKRVIGLPGETLSFKNGYTYVDGEKLDESYLPTQGITTLPDSMADKTFTVPEGCMFVMGDNRTGSNYSRLLGEPYIPIEAVQARMLVAISVGSDQSWQGIRWIG